jgi:hypothetical protein
VRGIVWLPERVELGDERRHRVGLAIMMSEGT